MQTIFYQLIEEQTKTIMLANVRKDYVFKTIDPAIIPEEKDKPKRALIVILGTMLGGMLSIFISLILYFTVNKKSSVESQSTLINNATAPIAKTDFPVKKTKI